MPYADNGNVLILHAIADPSRRAAAQGKRNILFLECEFAHICCSHGSRISNSVIVFCRLSEWLGREVMSIAECPLAELVDDPLVGLIMKSDGVNRAALRTLLERVARAIASHSAANPCRPPGCDARTRQRSTNRWMA